MPTFGQACPPGNSAPINLGATGNECLLFLVAMYFLTIFALRPLSRMILARRWRPAVLPSSWSRLAILGAPSRPFYSSNTGLISTASNWFASALPESGLRLQA